eukprot:768104-Hanusia_phi.AAC.10
MRQDGDLLVGFLELNKDLQADLTPVVSAFNVSDRRSCAAGSVKVRTRSARLSTLYSTSSDHPLPCCYLSPSLRCISSRARCSLVSS